MTFDTILAYINSPEFSSFLQDQLKIFVLVAMLIAFIALLFELRLPVRSYWGLPGHTLGRLWIRLGFKKSAPVWGTCTDQATGQLLSLVAVELLDVSTQKVLKTTYTDNNGQYGFPLKPGRYLARASKSHYQQPSFLNPENIEIKTVQNAFVAEVVVVNHQTAPLVDLALQNTGQASSSTFSSNLSRYGRMFFFQLGHLLVIFSAIMSILALRLTWDTFYVVILGLCLVLLFIKLYLLQMIGLLAQSNPKS